MIKADHKKWARFFFNPYIDRLLRKHFSHFYMVNPFPEIPKEQSLIVTPNHISWWDGFFIDYITRKHLHRKMFLMMLESSLNKYWFFNKLGAFSIEPENSRSIINTVKYTKEILADSKNFLITYPQGEIEPFGKRPLTIKEGLKLFIKDEEQQIMILPVGFKIQYYNERNPSIVCRIGNLVKGNNILDDFNTYTDAFLLNVDALSKAVYDKSFEIDLFA